MLLIFSIAIHVYICAIYVRVQNFSGLFKTLKLCANPMPVLCCP